MIAGVKTLLKSQKGAASVEYGLIIALVVIAIMTAVSNVATKTNSMWANVSNEVTKN